MSARADEQIRADMVEVGRRLYARGYVASNDGNISVRLGDGLAAGVPFYGAQPKPEDVAKIKAPINAQYGELDTRITSGWPAFDAALTAAKVVHEGHVYPGAGLDQQAGQLRRLVSGNAAGDAEHDALSGQGAHDGVGVRPGQSWVSPALSSTTSMPVPPYSWQAQKWPTTTCAASAAGPTKTRSNSTLGADFCPLCPTANVPPARTASSTGRAADS